MKYTVVDGRDVSLLEHKRLEAHMQVSRDGEGAAIFALLNRIPLQQVIWEVHRGRVPDKMVVVHSNGVSVDNRLENLRVVREEHFYLWVKSTLHSTQTKDDHLYWLAISQLPPEPCLAPGCSEKHRKQGQTGVSGQDAQPEENSDDYDEMDDTQLYYECHYAPCTRIEAEVRQFSICGRCQEARYCGAACQQRDWACHKRECRERLRRFALVDWASFPVANPER